MTLYKLTDKDGYTRRGLSGETLWGPGVSHTATGDKAELCTDGVIHAYTDPWLGLFLDPLHAGFGKPRLWEAEGEVVAEAWDKVGVRTLTVQREILYIPPTVEQRVRFAIRCAWPGANAAWRLWAQAWLSGINRTAQAAWAARAEAAARAAGAAEAEAAWAAGAAWAAEEAAAEAAAGAAEAGAADFAQYAQWAMGTELEI